MTKEALTRNEALKNYILNNIDATGYNVPTPTTEEEKIKFLIDTFRNEYVHKNSLSYYGTYQNVFVNWLKGLPSCIDLPIYYYDIEKQLTEFNFITEFNKEKAIKRYYDIVYMCIFKIAKKYKLQNLLINYLGIN